MNFSFIIGEKKYIQFEIRSMIQQKVVITEATWILLDTKGKEVLTGNCEIEDNILRLLLEPDAIGEYILEVTYSIPPEIRKVRCEINVS